MNLREGVTRFFGHPKAKEAFGILLMACAILLMASLLSFDPSDPSFFHFQDDQRTPVRNLGGRFGAHLAGDLLELVGASSFFLPILLFWLGWMIFRRQRLTLWGLKLAGFLILLICFSVFSRLLFPGIHLFGFHLSRGGGLLGEGLVGWLSPSLGNFGLYLLTLTGMVIAIILLSQLSLQQLLASIMASLSRAKARLNEAWSWARKSGKGVKVGPGSQEASLVRESRPVEPSRLAVRPEPVTGAVGEGRPEGGEEKEEELAPPPAIGYRPPPLSLFQDPPSAGVMATPEELSSNSAILEQKLLDFGVEGRVTEVYPGPVITRYELEPAPGIKINRIVSLADDLALALKALSVRVIAPIPGKAVVGVEIPNQNRSIVHIKEVLSAPQFLNSPSWLTLALGKDIAGFPYVVDLIQMPHLLIAGATGTGKSVCINSLIISMICKASPDQVKFLLIDPKMVELSAYNGLPHLADVVMTDSKEASKKLIHLVSHMEERYRLLAAKGVRNIAAYNRLLEEGMETGELEAPAGPPLPFLVVIIDELADLMMTASAEVETAVTRLAQMARGVGIHLILATQRPSVDVITGLIKANFPSRISFQVSSKTDSRTILDMNGAEQLLGNGDMLYLPSGSSKPIRIHGCFISEGEIERVVGFLRSEVGPWKKLPLFDRQEARETSGEEADEFYQKAVDLVLATRQASISLIQRRLRVGYNRAARMIERMEEEGIVSPMDSGKGREVLIERKEEGWAPPD
jgi:DNA segregation ATPase FtsK/SpoIIIE, S-DNA-T family